MYVTMSTFFEIFPVVLVRRDGIVRTNVPFRRVELKYNVEQACVTIKFYGDELDRMGYSHPCTMKKYARRA